MILNDVKVIRNLGNSEPELWPAGVSSGDNSQVKITEEERGCLSEASFIEWKR
jgi:hypothetical protein